MSNTRGYFLLLQVPGIKCGWYDDGLSAGSSRVVVVDVDGPLSLVVTPPEATSTLPGFIL